MLIKKIIEFGDRISEEGKKLNCTPLINYGTNICEAAKQFDIHRIEYLLYLFQKICKKT